MDTPYWERLQYVGDTRIQALISYTVAGDDRLARQAINAFDESRLPDGITLSRYPTALFQAIPTFFLLWVGMLKDFALYHDDAEFVRQHLPGCIESHVSDVPHTVRWHAGSDLPPGLRNEAGPPTTRAGPSGL
jgi:hypothetical protein